MEKPIQRDRENRSNAEYKDITFHPFTITAETAQTSVVLLESNEPEILCMTLRAITKFSAQDNGNRRILFNLNAIHHILRHVDHPEMNVRRFALKALAQLCQLPRGPEQVLENPVNMKRIAAIVLDVEDVYVLEFALLVLAELTREPLGCEQLLEGPILNSLFKRMKGMLDPDIQKNCLQTLSNLLNDPVCAAEVTKSQHFCWASILALLQSKYVEIQDAALKTVDQLLCRYKDKAVQDSFKESTGVSDLCDILESYELRDVHIRVLNILRNYAETSENALHMFQSGGLLRLLPYMEMALLAAKPHCLAVLTKLSCTAEGRDALYQTGSDLVLCQQLLDAQKEQLADAALGVANMTQLLASAMRMSETNIIEALCAILSDDDAAVPWFDIKMNALRALGELCRVIPKAALSLVEPNTFGALRNINRKYKDDPIEAQRLAVQCYINLLSYTVSTRAMLNSSFIAELIRILRRPDIQLKILACTVLSGLMKEKLAQGIFTKLEGETLVSLNLKIEHVGLRTALCLLIVASVTDEGADLYLDLGTVHYMVENRMARFAVSVWESALEAIFRHNASAKLAYTGRLDINDFTQDGFYVEKRLSPRFPSMMEVLNGEPPNKEPVFVCLFERIEPEVLGPSPQPTRRQSTSSHVSARSRGHSQSTRERLSSFEGLPDDFNLREYLSKLRVWLGDPSQSTHFMELEDGHFEVRYRTKCHEVSSTLKQKAQILAEFVVEQMCGLTQERDCSMPSVNLHLADLMLDTKSRVLGIGWVRCGGPLERAVLYKVLADRVGVPCALCRTGSKQAWCELAVPELSLSDIKRNDENPDIKYPAGLLRANYVVDLMHDTGRLYKKGTYEAERICGTNSQ